MEISHNTSYHLQVYFAKMKLIWKKCYGNVMKMELPGEKRGRPKRRFLDVVKENMGKVGARKMDIENRTV